MKRKINKKLFICKEYIARLNEYEQGNSLGGTISGLCSDSCTVLGGICCDSIKQCLPPEEKADLG